MKYLISLTLLFWISSVLAQNGVIPYLGENGLYGLANEKGKLVVEPIYEEINFHESGEFMIIKKQGLYGVINLKGQTILEPIMPSRQGFLLASNIDEYGDKIKPPKLYYFRDNKQKSVYYINPYHPLDNSQYHQFMALSEATREIKRLSNSFNSPGHLIFKVAEDYGKINFIDTTGRLILSNPVYDGKVIDKRHMALRNKNNIYALRNMNGELLTDYKFKTLIGSRRGWFVGSVNVEGGKKYSQLLDKDGQVLLDNKEFISIKENGLLQVRDQDSEVLMLSLIHI